MTRFGSDKPDTRVGMELQPLPELGATAAGFVVVAKRPWQAKMTEQLCNRMDMELGASRTRVVTVEVRAGGKYRSSARLPSAHVATTAALARLGVGVGEAVVVAHSDGPEGDGSWGEVHETLGRLRVEVARALRETGDLPDPGAAPDFLWVTDFPAFERNGQGQWVCPSFPRPTPTLRHPWLLASTVPAPPTHPRSPMVHRSRSTTPSRHRSRLTSRSFSMGSWALSQPGLTTWSATGWKLAAAPSEITPSPYRSAPVLAV
jgi:aspartyl-tRNA synthetase